MYSYVAIHNHPPGRTIICESKYCKPLLYIACLLCEKLIDK